MLLIKKLAFAPLFLISLALTSYEINSLFRNPYSFIFALDLNSLYFLIGLCFLIFLSSLFFIIFAVLADSWLFIAPVALIGAILLVIFTPTQGGILMGTAFVVSMLAVFFALSNKLKTYLNFTPLTLFSPDVKNLAKALTIAICLGYFLTVNLEIQKNGFQIPDQLLDTVTKFSTPQIPVQGFKTTKLAQAFPGLTPEQIQMLKQNPALLKQSGIDPKLLDQSKSTNQSQNNLFNIPSSNNLIKPILKNQLQKMVDPYVKYMPLILALLLFITLYSFLSLVTMLTGVSLWIIFFVLEKSEFIKFTMEQRPVKKLVV